MVERVPTNLNESLTTNRYHTFLWGLGSLTLVTAFVVWRIQSPDVQMTAIIALASFAGGAIGLGNVHDWKARVAKIAAEKEAVMAEQQITGDLQKIQLGAPVASTSQDLFPTPPAPPSAPIPPRPPVAPVRP